MDIIYLMNNHLNRIYPRDEALPRNGALPRNEALPRNGASPNESISNIQSQYVELLITQPVLPMEEFKNLSFENKWKMYNDLNNENMNLKILLDDCNNTKFKYENKLLELQNLNKINEDI